MYPYFEGLTQDVYFHHHDYAYSYPPHFHNKVELVYCFEGKVIKRLGDSTYTLHSGDALIIFPNIVHETLLTTDEEKVSSLSVVCKTGFFSGLLPDFATKRPANPVIPADKISQKVLGAFQKILSAKNSAEVLGWTLVALSDLVHQLELEPIKNQDGFSLAPRMIEYINENYQKPLSINYLAKAFGYSASYITHVFCEQLKVPFRSYLTAVRSEHAADLILSTSKSLSEIAFEAGFNSLNTFCRCFKNRYNMTPSEYKKAMREKKNAE
ncbi:MAG: helix-turn-helix transcriptional regulator [Clostridia bacterium]|nr:helix-turn-helix transcriptional regulator [Clostridia bacterium]